MNSGLIKGIIALDIDGTITVEHHSISPIVSTFFQSLYREGWQFLFATGRTFQWGYEVLSQMPFPYFFAVQNGAIILEMPSKKILVKRYLDGSIFPVMEEICKEEDSDFIIYGGYEFEDRCYYRPAHFEENMLNYLKKRVEILKEKWTPLDSFDQLPLVNFSSVKCFGNLDSAKRMAEKMEKILSLHCPIIRDPFNNQCYIAQGTNPEVSKGQAINELKKFLKVNVPVIAAGDDNNDISMLEEANIKIVMETAPSDMKVKADVIAPGADKNGIIAGLGEAIRKLQKS